ncbi:MAG: hypothetical protein ACRD2E_10980 [Terriglobales bacterium]
MRGWAWTSLTLGVVFLACAAWLAPAVSSSGRARASRAAQLGSRLGSQGCVNQGADRRYFAPLICSSQRRFSWKSNGPPRLWIIGNPRGTSVGLAWPPYLVFNTPRGRRWQMFRIGFRYDRNWRGYIFPTVACKGVSRPLRY